MNKQLLNIAKELSYTVEKALGLEVKRYKTGNVKHTVLDGYEISHSQCNKILSRYSNGYYDFVSGEWSFDTTSDEYGMRIDEFFRKNGEIC